MFGKEVVGKDGAGRCGVVACEYEKFDLRHGKVFELLPARSLILSRGCRVLGAVGVHGEIDDRFLLGLVTALNIFVAVIELTREVPIHPVRVV